MADLNARAAEITEAENTTALGPHPGFEVAVHPGAEAHAPGRPVVVPGVGAVPRVPARGEGQPRLGRRRQRVPRLPQRLRLDGRRPRAPEGRRGDRARRAHRHALRRADRGHGPLRRGAVPALPGGLGAVLQLRHRGDDERDPHRARGHRTRAHRQDRRLVPRSSRRGDVLGRAELRHDGRPRSAGDHADVERHPRGDGASTRTSCRSTTSRCSPRCSTSAATRSRA